MNKLLVKSECLKLEQIQSYLGETLNEDDRFAVENHLLDCPLCSDAVEGFANSHNTGEVPMPDFLKKSIPEKTVPAVVRQLPARRAWPMRIAASLLLLAIPISGYLYWQSNSMDRLIAANFTDATPSVIGVLRSGDASLVTDATLQNGLEDFQNKQYGNSFRAFTTMLERQPEHTVAAFYAGIAAAKIENWSAAEKYLQSTRINAPLYYDQATWHLAGVYLQQKKQKEAEALLMELVDKQDSNYRDRAVSLLKKLV